MGNMGERALFRRDNAARGACRGARATRATRYRPGARSSRPEWAGWAGMPPHPPHRQLQHRRRLRRSEGPASGVPRALPALPELLDKVTDLKDQVDVEQVKEYVSGAKNYLESNYDVDLDPQALSNQASTALDVAKDAGQTAIEGANEYVIKPAWDFSKPELEKYFRGAWGDYNYDYFIKEWNDGVTDLGRLYNFLKNDVVAGDWRRLLGLVGTVYFSPAILRTAIDIGKGYKGQASPVEAVQLLQRRDGVLIDTRSDNEKASSGIPDLPSNVRSSYIDVGFAGEWLGNDVRRQLRDSKVLESKATATVIADLKQVNKDRAKVVVLLDGSDNGRASSVAKCLTKDQRLKNVYVIKGGFQAWKKDLKVRVSPNAAQAKPSSSLKNILSR